MSFIRKTFIASLLTIAALPAFSQVGELRNNFSIGVNGGVNFNSLSLTPQGNQGAMLMGYAGGITARYISEKYFAMICGLQVELNYTQRGWKELVHKDMPDEVYRRTMNYLEVPFLAHLAFGREKGVRFFINLGPQVAFLLNEKGKTTELWEKGTVTLPNETSKDVQFPQHTMDADRKFDYGIVGGLGLELRTKAGNFLVEGRYYFGLADIFDNSRSATFSRSAHSTILGRVTYLFDLKK